MPGLIDVDSPVGTGTLRFHIKVHVDLVLLGRSRTCPLEAVGHAGTALINNGSVRRQLVYKAGIVGPDPVAALHGKDAVVDVDAASGKDVNGRRGLGEYDHSRQCKEQNQ